MNYRKKIIIGFILSLMIPVLIFIKVSLKEGLPCNNFGFFSCLNFVLDEKYILFIILPLFISASLLFVIFFSEKVFNVWKKFSIFFIPIMLIGIILTKVNPNECGSLVCVDRTFIIFFSGILYLIFSIFITSIYAIYFRSKTDVVV